MLMFSYFPIVPCVHTAPDKTEISFGSEKCLLVSFQPPWQSGRTFYCIQYMVDVKEIVQSYCSMWWAEQFFCTHPAMSLWSADSTCTVGPQGLPVLPAHYWSAWCIDHTVYGDLPPLPVWPIIQMSSFSCTLLQLCTESCIYISHCALYIQYIVPGTEGACEGRRRPL